MILKQQHRLFIDHYIAHGCTNASASYRSVYPKASEATSTTNASRLLRLAHVKEYLASAIAASQIDMVISKEELIQDLQRIKNTHKDRNPQAAIKAIEVLAKMMGYNAPIETKQDITVSQDQPLFGPLVD